MFGRNIIQTSCSLPQPRWPWPCRWPVPSILPRIRRRKRAQVRVVPEGNRYRNQPRIPFSSARRTKAAKSSYDAKFEKVLAVLKRDRRLISSIKRVARVYGIDPIHMIGAIIGEHTYNYDTLDSAQSYYIKALAYAGIDISFEYNDENVEDFVQRPQFDRCRKGKSASNSDRLWSCYERVWNGQFRNRRVDGTRYPEHEFQRNPFSSRSLPGRVSVSASSAR